MLEVFKMETRKQLGECVTSENETENLKQSYNNLSDLRVIVDQSLLSNFIQGCILLITITILVSLIAPMITL